MSGKASEQGLGEWVGVWNETSQDPRQGTGGPRSGTQQVQTQLLISASLPPVFLTPLQKEWGSVW